MKVRIERRASVMKKLLMMINPVTAKNVITPHLVDVVDIFEKVDMT